MNGENISIFCGHLVNLHWVPFRCYQVCSSLSFTILNANLRKLKAKFQALKWRDDISHRCSKYVFNCASCDYLSMWLMSRFVGISSVGHQKYLGENFCKCKVKLLVQYTLMNKFFWEFDPHKMSSFIEGNVSKCNKHILGHYILNGGVVCQVLVQSPLLTRQEVSDMTSIGEQSVFLTGFPMNINLEIGLSKVCAIPWG